MGLTDSAIVDRVLNVEFLQFDDVTLSVGDGIAGVVVNGTSFDDADLVGTVLDDILRGLEGNDRVSGLSGNDDIDGGIGNDTLLAGAGEDTLTGGTGSDLFVISADTQQDIVTDFTDGDDLLDLSDFNLFDAQNAVADAVQIGSDLELTFADGTQVTLQDVTKSSFDLADVILETNLSPSAADDAFSIDSDAVFIGNVFADNGNGADTDPNGDTLNVIDINGQSVVPGQTVSLASSAILTLFSDGYFQYDTNSAFDAIAGGVQTTDIFDYTIADPQDAEASASVTIDITGVSEEFLLGTSGDDALDGSGAPSFAFGRDGNDTIDGGAGRDTLFGNAGNDSLDGSAGDDEIDAGSSNDTVIGGTGNDTLTGGDGLDSFVFALTAGQDVISDFETGSDLIDLRGTELQFANLAITETSLGAQIVYDTLTNGQILLSGITAADLTSSSFIFDAENFLKIVTKSNALGEQLFEVTPTTFDTGQNAGVAEVSEDGSTVTLTDNAWKQVDVDVEITEDTILSFEFKSDVEGEIQAIGFDTDNTISSDQTFQLDGNAVWGLQSENGAYTSGSGWQSYEIRVGDYFTGDFSKLVFVADDDAGLGSDTSFRNIEIEDQIIFS